MPSEGAVEVPSGKARGEGTVGKSLHDVWNKSVASAM